MTACASAVGQAPQLAQTPSQPVPTQTLRLSPAPTITPLPTPTPYPSPLPTILIPMLTPSAPLTPTVQPRPERWALPERTVPEPFGVEIHFTRASQQELDYLAASGVRWVRMDMFWHTVETSPGRYNFSEYDALVNAMTQRGIRIIFILDYGNPLYDHGFPPTSSGGQAAFARFAAVAASRYRDAGVIWEIWNEPNLDHFWTPEANATAYGNLAMRAATAIRQVDPGALIVAPALCGYEWSFWRALGEMGLFQKLDALTVHAYGVDTPESVLGPYLELRALVDEYSPRWKIPILSGEWGFPTTEGGMSEGQQAQYLPRQWLFNLAYDIDLSVWYDWRDDGWDRHDPEQNFGTVHHDYTAKTSYYAARTLATTLSGYRFLRKVPLDNAEDYLLLFQNDGRVAMALWTTGHAHTVRLPISVDEAEVVEMTGERSVLTSKDEELEVPVTQSPRYLLFRADQAPAYLGGWRPAGTINTLNGAEEEASVPLVLEPYHGLPLYGDLQIWVRGELRGHIQVSASPMTETYVRLPLNLDGLSGNVPAEIALVSEDLGMAPLQRASIWLQIRLHIRSQ
ncbi:MAG: cellulase family glycosylhydrolase [Anaerolineae bacterium]